MGSGAHSRPPAGLSFHGTVVPPPNVVGEGHDGAVPCKVGLAGAAKTMAAEDATGETAVTPAASGAANAERLASLADWLLLPVLLPPRWSQPVAHRRVAAPSPPTLTPLLPSR